MSASRTWECLCCDEPAPDERDLECPYCDGNGEIDHGFVGFCQHTGAELRNTERCEHCNGRGGYMQPVYPITEADLDDFTDWPPEAA